MRNLAFVILLLCLGSAAAAAVYTVPNPPFITRIGQALVLTGPGDIVEVQPGVYYEHALVLPGGVTLRGLGDADNPVVIDGQEMGRVISCSTWTATGTIIENLVIRNGDGTHGGGLFINNASPRIQDVRFENNEAWYGGGVQVRGTSYSEFVRCDFVGNLSHTSGGGLLANGAGTLTFTDCLFAGNTADAAGGGLCISGPKAVHLVRCTVVDNAAPHGAGLSGWMAGPFSGENCLIAANQGREYMGDTPSTPHFTCTDIALHAGGDWSGGLVHQTDIDGNFSADPLFCGDVSPEDPWSIDAASPCAPENLPGCGRVGARYIGCSSGTGLDPELPDPDDQLPSVTKLHACRPNPFNPATVVSFDLHLPGEATLRVFDTRGHLVAELHRGGLGVGTHEFTWQGRDGSGRSVPTGVYFAQLRTATHLETRRMALIK